MSELEIALGVCTAALRSQKQGSELQLTSLELQLLSGTTPKVFYDYLM